MTAMTSGQRDSRRCYFLEVRFARRLAKRALKLVHRSCCFFTRAHYSSCLGMVENAAHDLNIRDNDLERQPHPLPPPPPAGSTVSSRGEKKLQAQRKYNLINTALTLIPMAILCGLLALAVKVIPLTKRVWYCEDMSLRHPYTHQEMFPMTIAGAIGVAIVCLAVLLTDAANLYIFKVQCSKLQIKKGVMTLRVTNYVVTTVQLCLIIAIGGLCVLLVAELGKKTVGRLRPHFLTVCFDLSNHGLGSPNASATPTLLDRTCKDQFDKGMSFNFRTGPECTGKDHEKIEEARKSFPSGHSTFGFYTGFIAVFYMQFQLRGLNQCCKVTRFVVQVLMVSVGWVIALSRVHDYFHHPTDVLAGSVLGTLGAAALAFATGVGSHRTDILTP